MGDYQDMPTVLAPSVFVPFGDANVLHDAMKGLGTSEQEIIDVLCRRTNSQRQAISHIYTREFQTDLVDDLKSELGGNFESVIVGLMLPTADYCAKQLHKAMKGAGTDEETLVEVLCSRSSEEIMQIAAAYEDAYGNSLEADINGDTSGPLNRLLVMTVKGRKNEGMFDAGKAAEQAATLYRAGEAKLGTDEDAFVDILGSAGQRQAYLILEEYKKIAGRTIEQALNDELSGDLLKGLLALVKTMDNRAQYFAERLEAAMKGWGTDDTALIRIIVSRCEIDLGNIKHQYERLYGRTLLSAVKSECSGDYLRALSALIGAA